MFGFSLLKRKSEGSLPHQVKTSVTSYQMELQPWSFSVSLAPVALGNVLSWRDQSKFSLAVFLFSTVVVLAVHAAGNALHAHRGKGEKKNEEQLEKSERNERPKAMVQIEVLLYVLACVSMLGVTYFSPAKVEHLAILFFGGLSASFLYTGIYNPQYFLS